MFEVHQTSNTMCLRLFCFLIIAITILPSYRTADDTMPFNFSKRPVPKDSDFKVILPKNVAGLKLVSFTPPQPDSDGEAIYKGAEGEIFMLFSFQETAADVESVMQTIYDEVKKSKTTKAPVINLKKSPYYLHYLGPKIAFFAWTRKGYCFSADAKNADSKLLDKFMNAFPY